MPRNVRNFWIELDVDGSRSRVATGPQAAGGGFDMVIKMRDKGDIVTGLRVRGYVDSAGKIALETTPCGVMPDPTMAHGQVFKTER